MGVLLSGNSSMSDHYMYKPNVPIVSEVDSVWIQHWNCKQSQ